MALARPISDVDNRGLQEGVDSSRGVRQRERSRSLQNVLMGVWLAVNVVGLVLSGAGVFGSGGGFAAGIALFSVSLVCCAVVARLLVFRREGEDEEASTLLS